jgi:hypothetical protein
MLACADRAMSDVVTFALKAKRCEPLWPRRSVLSSGAWVRTDSHRQSQCEESSSGFIPNVDFQAGKLARPQLFLADLAGGDRGQRTCCAQVGKIDAHLVFDDGVVAHIEEEARHAGSMETGGGSRTGKGPPR